VRPDQPFDGGVTWGESLDALRLALEEFWSASAATDAAIDRLAPEARKHLEILRVGWLLHLRRDLDDYVSRYRPSRPTADSEGRPDAANLVTIYSCVGELLDSDLPDCRRRVILPWKDLDALRVLPNGNQQPNEMITFSADRPPLDAPAVGPANTVEISKRELRERIYNVGETKFLEMMKAGAIPFAEQPGRHAKLVRINLAALTEPYQSKLSEYLRQLDTPLRDATR
jgi:hypothetical protein